MSFVSDKESDNVYWLFLIPAISTVSFYIFFEGNSSPGDFNFVMGLAGPAGLMILTILVLPAFAGIIGAAFLFLSMKGPASFMKDMFRVLGIIISLMPLIAVGITVLFVGI